MQKETDKDENVNEAFDEIPERTELPSDTMYFEETNANDFTDNVAHAHRIYDLADIVMDRRSVSSLKDEDKYGYITLNQTKRCSNKK